MAHKEHKVWTHGIVILCIFDFDNINFVVYKPMQNPEEIIENERAIKYKLIELQNMAIYWDTDVTLVGDLPSKDLEASSNSSTYT